MPIEIHKEHNCYVPELIFGQLLTSSNYDDTEEKVTGGRNGFGAKLTNIFSKMFEIETASSAKGKKYRQRFYDNMKRKDEPIITDLKRAEDYTCVRFQPDLKLFGMDKLTDDTIALFTKRAYDMAGVTNKKVRVEVNGKRLDIKDFTSYVDLYLKNEEGQENPTVT